MLHEEEIRAAHFCKQSHLSVKLLNAILPNVHN